MIIEQNNENNFGNKKNKKIMYIKFKKTNDH